MTKRSPDSISNVSRFTVLLTIAIFSCFGCFDNHSSKDDSSAKKGEQAKTPSRHLKSYASENDFIAYVITINQSTMSNDLFSIVPVSSRGVSKQDIDTHLFRNSGEKLSVIENKLSVTFNIEVLDDRELFLTRENKATIITDSGLRKEKSFKEVAATLQKLKLYSMKTNSVVKFKDIVYLSRTLSNAESHLALLKEKLSVKRKVVQPASVLSLNGKQYIIETSQKQRDDILNGNPVRHTTKSVSFGKHNYDNVLTQSCFERYLGGLDCADGSSNGRHQVVFVGSTSRQVIFYTSKMVSSNQPLPGVKAVYIDGPSYYLNRSKSAGRNDKGDVYPVENNFFLLFVDSDEVNSNFVFLDETRQSLQSKFKKLTSGVQKIGPNDEYHEFLSESFTLIDDFYAQNEYLSAILILLNLTEIALNSTNDYFKWEVNNNLSGFYLHLLVNLHPELVASSEKLESNPKFAYLKKLPDNAQVSGMPKVFGKRTLGTTVAIQAMRSGLYRADEIDELLLKAGGFDQLISKPFRLGEQIVATQRDNGWIAKAIDPNQFTSSEDWYNYVIKNASVPRADYMVEGVEKVIVEYNRRYKSTELNAELGRIFDRNLVDVYLKPVCLFLVEKAKTETAEKYRKFDMKFAKRCVSTFEKSGAQFHSTRYSDKKHYQSIETFREFLNSI
tara:strand:- start:888 stop:2900 length:2013 start_codon:yes stop_codon:yes gene_type:complete